MHPLSLPAVLGAAALSLSSCASVPQPDHNSPSVDPQTSAGLVLEHLDCESVRDVAQDLTRFALSRGADCSTIDGEVFVRAYADSNATARALRDWQPLASRERELVATSYWLAIGPVSRMSRVRSLPGASAIGPADHLPPTNEPSESEADRDTCMQFVASALRDQLLDSSPSALKSGDLDALYPGLDGFLADVATPTDAATARRLDKRDDNSSEAFLSSFGPSMREFCADVA